MRLTPAPGTGTVGQEQAKESADSHAFEDFCPGNALHRPAFGKIVKSKTQHTACSHGDERPFKVSRSQGPFQAAAFGFYLQWFELHICKYIDV